MTPQEKKLSETAQLLKKLNSDTLMAIQFVIKQELNTRAVKELSKLGG